MNYLKLANSSIFFIFILPTYLVNINVNIINIGRLPKNLINEVKINKIIKIVIYVVINWVELISFFNLSKSIILNKYIFYLKIYYYY